MSNIVKVDKAYSEWIENISKSFRQSQIKAAVKANNEMIRFYWNLGKEMDLKKNEYNWGSHFFSQVSEDLKKELPGVKSFSPRNLLYMHQFFKLFPDAGNTQQVGAQIDTPENTQQAVAQMTEKELVFFVPWGHITQIIDKCKKDSKKALFYVKKTLENNWSRAMLLNFLDTDLYERQGKAVTNFRLTLPEDQSDLAQQIFSHCSRNITKKN